MVEQPEQREWIISHYVPAQPSEPSVRPDEGACAHAEQHTKQREGVAAALEYPHNLK